MRLLAFLLLLSGSALADKPEMADELLWTKYQLAGERMKNALAAYEKAMAEQEGFRKDLWKKHALGQADKINGNGVIERAPEQPKQKAAGGK